MKKPAFFHWLFLPPVLLTSIFIYLEVIAAGSSFGFLESAGLTGFFSLAGERAEDFCTFFRKREAEVSSKVAALRSLPEEARKQRCLERVENVNMFSLSSHNMLDQFSEILENVLIRKPAFYNYGPNCHFTSRILCFNPFHPLKRTWKPMTPQEVTKIKHTSSKLFMKDRSHRRLPKPGTPEADEVAKIVSSLPGFQESDVVLCNFHPASICSLLLKEIFAARKKLLVLPGWRFDQGLKGDAKSSPCLWTHMLGHWAAPGLACDEKKHDHGGGEPSKWREKMQGRRNKEPFFDPFRSLPKLKKSKTSPASLQKERIFKHAARMTTDFYRDLTLRDSELTLYLRNLSLNEDLFYSEGSSQGESPEWVVPEVSLAAITDLDRMYMEFFLGKAAKDIPVIEPCAKPSWLHMEQEIPEEKRALDHRFLFFPARKKERKFTNEPNYKFFDQFLNPVINGHSPSPLLVPAASLFKEFEPQELTRFRGAVWIPYAPTTCLLSEMFAAGIPIFVPSLSLLSSWTVTNEFHHKAVTHLGAMYETFNVNNPGCPLGHTFFEGMSEESFFSHHPLSVFSSEKAGQQWFNGSIFYQHPYFLHFSSAADLKRQLEAFSLEQAREHSRKQREYVRSSLFPQIEKGWRRALAALFPEDCLPSDQTTE